MRLRIALLVLLAAVVASTAQAGSCLKCDQSTGYACFRSFINATHSGCDTPSDAGCALWGTCTVSNSGDDCPDNDCVFSLGQAAPMSNDMEVVAVTISVPSPRSGPRPATATTARQTAI